MPDLVDVCGGQSDTGTEFSSSYGMYMYLYIQFICGTISFNPSSNSMYHLLEHCKALQFFHRVCAFNMARNKQRLYF